MHFHTPARVTPYEILYNHGPPFHLPYLLGESHNEALDGTLQRKEEIITMLKYNLENAQHRMKQQADLHRSDKIFRVGDLIWLKVQPCCQTTVQQKVNTKLSPKLWSFPGIRSNRKSWLRIEVAFQFSGSQCFSCVIT